MSDNHTATYYQSELADVNKKIKAETKKIRQNQGDAARLRLLTLRKEILQRLIALDIVGERAKLYEIEDEPYDFIVAFLEKIDKEQKVISQ